MGKLLQTILIGAFTFATQNVWSQGWLWARGADKSAAHFTLSASHGWPVATDAAGNVYTALWSSNDSITIGANSYHSDNFKKQLILAKYDNNGNLLWTKATSNGSAAPIDIAVDKNNNLFLYGYFTGESVRFDGQLISRLYTSYTTSCFLIKLDASGNISWKVNAGTISVSEESQAFGSIAVDKQGNAYTTASYDNSVMIGATTLTNNGNEDVSVSKYSSVGGMIWAKRFGGTGYDRVSGMAVDDASNIYIAGEFSSPTIAFGSTTLSYYATVPAGTSTSFNSFVAQLNNDGLPVWAQQSKGNTRVRSLAVDSVNNIYMGGLLLDDLVTFGAQSLSMNANNPYLVKYNNTGSLLRTHAFVQTIHTTKTNNAIWSIAIDPCNNVWVSGGVDTTFGNGIFLDTSIVMPAPQDAIDPLFVASYTPEGGLIDYAVMRSGGESNSGLACDNSGNLFIGGYYGSNESLRIASDTLHTFLNVTKSFFLAKYQPYDGCVPNSVKQTENTRAEVNLYPNPANTTITITSASPITSVVIVDVVGKVVYNGNYNNNSAQIYIGNLQTGIYLVRINNQIIKKLVKE